MRGAILFQKKNVIWLPDRRSGLLAPLLLSSSVRAVCQRQRAINTAAAKLPQMPRMARVTTMAAYRSAPWGICIPSRRHLWSLRMSRNSFGPFNSRRFRLACSSGDADRSVWRSIVAAARSAALARVFGLCGCAEAEAAIPSSTKRRKASDRAGLSACRAAQPSTAPISSFGIRRLIIGSLPVAGRPRFLAVTFFRERFII